MTKQATVHSVPESVHSVPESAHSVPESATVGGSCGAAPENDSPAAPAPASTVDARGHRCPMPLLMAKRGLNALTVGDTLLLLSTDPGSAKDFEIFARQSGHELLDVSEANGEFHFMLRKR